MNIATVFFLRMLGIVLICASVASWFLRDSWGVAPEGDAGAISGGPAVALALAWAALWACAMGSIGFRSLKKALGCDPKKLLSVTMKGLLARLLILIASQALVFAIAGDEWGRRTLTATVFLYLAVLGVEVFTLNQALKSGVFQKAAADAENQARPTTEGNAGE